MASIGESVALTAPSFAGQLLRPTGSPPPAASSGAQESLASRSVAELAG